MKTRAGEYMTNLSGVMQYESFVPSSLPPNPPIVVDEEMLKLLLAAHRNLAKLEGISTQIANIDLFVSMYIRKEALLSSQIEGTQATLDDILDPNVEQNANLDIADVIKYIKASAYARNRLNELPLCNRLLREIHGILMTGTRGSEKNPGEFRKSQNWIGPAGSTIATSKFVPPNVEDMIQAMSDFEKYMNQDDDVDPLIKIALLHYQFETIHPFLDGNGRIGRLLITLWLILEKTLTHEILYMSYYFKRNRIEYYDRLTETRTKGNYEQWVKFFLKATMESADDAINTIRDMIHLHQKNLSLIEKTGKSVKNVLKLFLYLEMHPIIDINKASQDLQISFNTAASAVKKLVELGILEQTEGMLRNRVFAYQEYLNILRRDTEL
jgi:Fic family protein